MAEFGGVAQHLSHWVGWFVADGGGGHCFPAGHAATGFAFVGGYFALRSHLPRLARRWLVGAIAVGLVLGLVQQLRGAHFMSHTLWTAWICWMVGWLADPLFAGATRWRALHST
jgi:membrane-associated PAP2 superfamily phosphatase